MPLLALLLSLPIAIAEPPPADATPPSSDAAPAPEAQAREVAPAIVFKPEAQIRPRVEAHTGRDAAAGGSSVFFQQRSRLGGTVTLGKVAVRMVLQDVRMWGEEANTLTDFSADNLDVPMMCLTWKPSELATIHVGRQQWNLHEQRLIGAVNWAQQSRSFDGAFIGLKSKRLSADIAAAVLADADSATFDANGALIWGRVGWSTNKATVVDLVYIYDRDATADRTRHTTGLYAKAKAGPVSGRLEGYAQIGDVDGTPIRAWMASATVKWAPESKVKPTVLLGYDHLSGDDDPAAGNAAAFNTLFATNHKFYGFIDIIDFKKGGKADSRGLRDVMLKASVSPTKAVDLALHGHVFMADQTQGGESMIGQEIDLTAKFKLDKRLSFGIGGAVFLPTEGSTDLWSFAMIDAAL